MEKQAHHHREGEIFWVTRMSDSPPPSPLVSTRPLPFSSARGTMGPMEILSRVLLN